MRCTSLFMKSTMALALLAALPVFAEAQVRRRPPGPAESPGQITAARPADGVVPAAVADPVSASGAAAQRTARPRGGGESSGRAGSGRRSGGDSRSGGAVRRNPPSGEGRVGSDGSQNDGRGGGRQQANRGTSQGSRERVAIARSGRPPSAIPGWGSYPRSYRPSYWYRNYYRPSSWYWAPSGWGLGYWSYYDPYYAGIGPYAYGYGVGGRRYDDIGSVRLKVRPREAQVLVDGYFVGVVDDFDGTFQRLQLEEGPHTIQVRLAGYLPLDFPVYVTVDRTITLNGDLSLAP